MLSSEQLLEYATKEHTAEFKSAVERCKAANPDKDAGSCFAVITSSFQKAGKKIFLTKGDADFASVLLTGDTIFTEVELSSWSEDYIKDLPDSAFAYVAVLGVDPKKPRHFPYKDKEGKVDGTHLRIALSCLKQTNISADNKRKALKVLLAAAQADGIATTAELATISELIEYSDVNDDRDSTFADVQSHELETMTVELSGTPIKWESLGYALRVESELMRPGVYQGIDGRKCRWTDAVLSKYYKSLMGKPTKMFHLKEGEFKKDLPLKAGKINGFITHLAEIGGRVFYKSLVFPQADQALVKSGNYKESLEARVGLSKADASGVHNVKVWAGLGLAYTDTPAVGTEGIVTDPVALARKTNMPDPQTPGNPPADPPADPPTDPAVAPAVEKPDEKGITLSASDLQNIVKAAVEEATTELSKQVKDLGDNLKELSDVRDDARLAAVHKMEEDIKSKDEKFDFKQLYAEDAQLSIKEERLDVYIRGVNKGIELQLALKSTTIALADPANDEKEEDEICVEMYGKPYKELIAAPLVVEGGTK